MANKLSLLNETPQILDGPRLLHELLDFKKNSQSCAIDFTNKGRRKTYSYEEVDLCVGDLVVRIQEKLDNTIGTSQHVVPILLPQSPGLYLSELAILKSGGAFCPINLDAPKDRIRFVVGDVSAQLIITTPEFREAVTWEDGPEVIIVEESPVVPQNKKIDFTSRISKPLDLAYIMYTSGSSGTPKGVAVSHHAVSQSLLAHERHIPIFRRFLQFAAPSFDVSIFEIFFPMMRGATLVGCNRNQLLNNLPAMINDLEVDAAELTPTVVGALLPKRANVPGLKLLLTIGEMLTRPIVEEFGGSETQKSMLYGMYGPTEAAIHCTIHPEMKSSAKPGNIGSPLDTVAVFIAAANPDDQNKNIQFLPPGDIGELVLGGPQLAEGYLNRPEQNKTAFIHSEETKYYRTGDKARILEDGTVEMLGRIVSGQVKLRGQRIELGEIEDAVYRHPGIKLAVAAILGSSLVVFALSSDSRVKAQDTLRTCARWLPQFMVPTEVIMIQELPYLPSGKVDTRKLIADYQNKDWDSKTESSLNLIERTVKEVLQKILGNFPSSKPLSSVGLDSLKSIQVASALRLVGFKIATLDVIKAETLAELSVKCEKLELIPARSSTQLTQMDDLESMIMLNGNARNVESLMPCTPLQSAMLSETSVNKRAYRNWIEIEISGVKDLNQTSSALRDLAELNTILRSGFIESQTSKGYSQITWKSFLDSQIEEVDQFEYQYNEMKDQTLSHPIRFQIQQSPSSMKLLVHLHHALYDGWSLELILDDLDQLLAGNSPQLRPPYSRVSGMYANGDIAEAWISKDYWKDHLAHLETRQIPNFHSKKQSTTELSVASLHTSILTSELETAARSLFSSSQTIFQAAYALILSSYLGTPDICFGTVFSGRTMPVVGIEDIVGPCISTLPIRVDVSTSATLMDLVQDLNSINRKHLDHSMVPLRDIKLAGNIEPRQPLFDTLLIWQQTLHSYSHKRKHVSLVGSSDNLEFSLTLEVVPGDGYIELRANYDTSLFPKSQVELLLHQVEQVARLVVEKRKTPIIEVYTHLDDGVLSIENKDPEIEFRTDTLTSTVERIAVEDPNRTAICFASSIDGKESREEHLTYSELNLRANKMSNYLQSQNVLPDELVVICMEKCIDLYVCILAVIKSGAGYLPATIDTPPERLLHIIEESKINIIVAQTSLRPLLKSFEHIRVIYIDEIDLGIASNRNPVPIFHPNDVSYCIYTSGSTGAPKGVLVTYGNLLSNLEVLEELYPQAVNPRLLQSCSQAFDVSVFEIFYTWRIGGCLCSAEKDVLFKDIENSIRVLGITHLSLTPTVAALVDPKNVPNVKFLVTAGEAVTQKVYKLWAGRGLYQGYGPSETTNICTVRPRVTQHDFINNIGPPFRNTSAFVLSEEPDFSPVLRGGEGEFCFGGSQVFRGYIDPSQGIGKIVQHPKYGRLYRSGDFGRLMPDGSLAFTRRKDDQIKIRGQRVELSEITKVLIQVSHVADSVTIVVSGNDGSQRLISFWTTKLAISEILECLTPDQAIISKLYQHLESSLPTYMIPSALIPVSLLPCTAQGKINKRLLEQRFHQLNAKYLREASQTFGNTSINHDWSDLELQILKSLAQLLNLQVKDIGIDTSFFNLGIDSISAIPLARLLRDTTGKSLEISDILKYPTILRLAIRLSTQSKKIDVIVPLAAAFDFGFDKNFQQLITEKFRQAGKAIESILPCTPLQEAMLSAAETSSQTMYCNYVTFNITGNVSKLQDSLIQMIERHGILRTCFVSTDMPRYPFVQVILKKHKVQFGSANEIKIADLSGEVEPPYQINFIHDQKSTKMVMSMHHALYDGVALSVLYQEVEDLLLGKTLPQPVSFEPLLRLMVSGKLEESAQFWSVALANYLPCRLERFHRNIQEPESHEAHVIIRRRVTSMPLSWIEENARKHSTSLLSVMQTIWTSVIAELHQKPDVCFGNVVSGRTVPLDSIERLVAPCFNTLPSRLRNVHKISYLEAFRKFQALNADSLPFQLTPLRRLQSKYSPDGSRLFDTLLILQQPTRALDSSIWTIIEDDGVMDFPLVCEAVPNHSEDTLEIIVHCHSSYFDESSCLNILESFDTMLQSALENPRRQLLSPAVKELIATNIATQQKHVEEVAEQSVSAMNTSEIRIRDILVDFTDVPVDKIDKYISIFRLGLDSITTIQVAARLRKKGYSVKSSDILQHPTITQLSDFLESDRPSVISELEDYDFAAFEHRYRDRICSKLDLGSQVEAIRPCTAVQQGMLAQSLHSQGENYINSVWLEVNSEMSLSKMKSAWEIVVKEHEMLRTGFAQTGDATHPFVMITYTKDSFLLPWYAIAKDDQPKSLVIENLTRCPWNVAVRVGDSGCVLRLTAHHALYDAQSMQMILSDIALTFHDCRIPHRAPITSSLGSILMETLDSETRRDFWQLEGNKIIVNRFPDLTPLGISNNKSLVKEIYSKCSFLELEQYCRQSSVTMQSAGQAAWARLLSLYIGEASTTFGMTLSGRSINEDAECVPFPMIVTLPVTCDVRGSNKELLARTMRSNGALQNHQFTPLTSIQKWAGFHEGKIFDTLFAYQKLPEKKEEYQPPWKIIQEEASVDYAVSMEVQPTEHGQVALRLTFKEDLIPIEHAELILEQYDALFLDTIRDPQNPCDVAPDIGSKLLAITPARESTLPDSVTLLHQYVERGAQTWPDKTALEFATCLEPGNLTSQTWTYQQIDEESNRVANLLLDSGILPGEIVAICFDKCPQASFAIIGVLKSGGSYVALDPTAPSERLNFILNDSSAKLILTFGTAAEKVTSSTLTVIDLGMPSTYHAYSSMPPKINRQIVSQDVAYCLYTSGTTGTPKGCLITHENAVQAMLSFQRLFAGHWTSQSKWLQFASFHFDVSVLELFWSWSVGICVASAPRDLIFEDIASAIRELRITHIDLTPSLARLIKPADVPGLCKGVFITGGEQLRQDILDEWGEQSCIYNGYGPTEATIGCTMYPRVPKNGKPANIGPQFDNVGSFVLKPGTELPVLRGGIGELCVSGKLVGKGYLNRLELTTERFPTLQVFRERVYRTGDLVRILYDGTFIFLGRADDQIKLRGQRLELSEINEVIKKSTDRLDEVVTLVLKHITQQKEQLVTFLVSASTSSEQDIGSLISFIKEACQAKLPGYMVPTHFVPVKCLPLNANNKADSKQLATLYNSLSIDNLQNLIHSKHVQEWSRQEKRVVGIIAKAIDVDISAITPSSNIFELGMDSISIIAFSRGLQSAGLENAKLSIVKKHPNIGALVGAMLNEATVGQEIESTYIIASQNIAVFSQKHKIEVCKELGIENMDVECLSPCTPMQEGMIYQFLDNESALYFNRFEFRLDKGVEPRKILDSWNNAIQQLQILRTKFVLTDDGYAQVVMKSFDSNIYQPVDYSSMEKSAALRNPFSLSLSPANVLLVQIFHGLYDGNSMTMLLRHVIDEYRGVIDHYYGPSFHSSLAYGPLACVTGAKEFWTKHLEQWSNYPLMARSDVVEDVVATRTIHDLDGFEILHKKLEVTPQALIQAAWLSVLQNFMCTHLTIGVVTSGRAIDLQDADKVVGPLFNTVPFNIRIEPGTTAASLISTCHEFNMQMHMRDFQQTPLKDIQKWSPAPPGQSLFDALFVFRKEDAEEDFAQGVWIQEESGYVADYPLAFEATITAYSKLKLVIVAQGAMVTQSDATDLLGKMEEALLAIIQSSGKNIVVDNDNDLQSSRPTPNCNTVALTPRDEEDSSFQWSTESNIIRKEIASLANISVDKILESSSIFELGLDSIDVIKLASRLKKQDIYISVSAIIRNQTIASIMRKISLKNPEFSPITKSIIQETSQDLIRHLKECGQLPQDVKVVLPATPLQQSMVNEMIKSNYERYFNFELFKLKEDVDLHKLKGAIVNVFNVSPVLRTSFVSVDDPRSSVSFAQVIHDRSLHCTESSGEIPIDDLFQQFKQGSIELAAQGSLFQVHLVTRKEDTLMIMAIAHALYDGTSIRLLHTKIRDVYNQRTSTSPNYHPFLEEVFRSTTQEAKNFWKSTLSNIPIAKFPKKALSDSDNNVLVHRKDRQSRVSLKDIELLCKNLRITLQTLGQTCWTIVLAYLMGQLDVVFGGVISCRDSEEAHEVMFPLMNTVAVRAIIHGTLSEMLIYMQERSDTTRQFQHFPLGTAQAYALASRDNDSVGADRTLFDTLFIYQGRKVSVREDELYTSVTGASEVEFPVCVEMEIVDRSLIWTTACKSIVRTEQETEDIITMLDTVLERVVSVPGAPAFVVDGEGTSICELPKFQNPEKMLRKPKSSPVHSFEEVWNDTEISIRKALHKISSIPEKQIHKESTIFHIGLDSILVLKLPALFRNYGIKLNVSEILKAQTVAAMAELAQIEAVKAEPLDVDSILAASVAKIDVVAAIGDCDIGDVQCCLPVTAGQLYMIRMWQRSQGTLFYPSFTYTLKGDLDKSRLENAWKHLLARHEILRTGFFESGSGMVQVILKRSKNEVEYQIGSEIVGHSPSHDLGEPPLHLVVIQTEGQATVIELHIHHVLYDGISLPILIYDLQALYLEQSLASPTSDFKTFVARSIGASNQSSNIKDQTIAQNKWTEYLGRRDHTGESPSTPTPVNLNQRTEIFHPSVPIPSLKPPAQTAGVTIDAILLAALSKTHAISLSHQPKHITIGIYLANRRLAPTLAAPTLNILPLRITDPCSRPLGEIAVDIQRDLQLIGSGEMNSASLADIYMWTGVRVDFFVNILKDAASSNVGSSTKETDKVFIPVEHDALDKLNNHEIGRNVDEKFPIDERFAAYLPSVDVEIRYRDGEKSAEIDMGIFAPAEKLDDEVAKQMVEGFAEECREFS